MLNLDKILAYRTPRWMVFIADNMTVLFAIFMAYMLRFNFHVPVQELPIFYTTIGVIFGSRFISFWLFKIHAGIIQYTGAHDALRIFFIVAAVSALFALANPIYYHFYHIHLIPYSIIILEFIITLLLLVSYRVTVKIAYAELSKSHGAQLPVMIFGAGEAGIITKRALESESGSAYKVLGFFDDATTKANKRLDGVKVYPSSTMDKVLKERGATRLILAVQKLSALRKQEIIDHCIAHKIEVLNVPPVGHWINGKLSPNQIRKVRIEDLLGREEIKLSETVLRNELKGQVVMVSGAAGSIGQEIALQVASYSPQRLILIDQAETPLFHFELKMQSLYPQLDTLFVLADICNKDRMQQLFAHEKPHYVYHAAAYKHVPIIENNPSEAIRVNVLGTKNMADLALAHRTAKFVMVSTDKAVNPTNVMGASKRMAEMYVQAMQAQGSTHFITTRFGNVLGSNGSVIPLFEKQIAKGGPLTVTHPDITRYFMTIPEACSLVLEAGSTGQGGQIYVFDMGGSVRIADLAKKMIHLSGLEEGKDIKIQYTGLRPGEKLYEELLSNKENTQATHHKKIMIASVATADIAILQNTIAGLKEALHQQDQLQMIRLLKKAIKEYKSENSPFEILDK